MTRLLAGPSRKGDSAGSLADVRARIQAIETRLAAIGREIEVAGTTEIDEGAVARALSQFDGVWESLWPTERTSILGLLVEGIDYDGRDKRTAIRFRSDGIGRLAAGRTT